MANCCGNCYWSDTEAFDVMICLNREGNFMFEMRMPNETCDLWQEDTEDGIQDK